MTIDTTSKLGRVKAGPRQLRNSMQVEMVRVAALKSNPESARRFNNLDDRLAARVLDAHEFIPPSIVDDDNMILVGEIYLKAARKLKIEALPVIRVEHLTEVQKQELSLAYQRLNELGHWDSGQLVKLHLQFEVEIPDYQPEQIGFSVGEIDIKIRDASDDSPWNEDIQVETVPVSAVGDVWHLGKHRIVCGDSTQPSVVASLMSGVGKAALMFTDPPFGCPIDGFVSKKGQHREFVMGSGEMSRDELHAFFGAFIANGIEHLKPGAVVEIVIDWRSLSTLMAAAEPLLGNLVNFAVWAKDRAGQGSFLRSQHELVLIFKVGTGRFLNNVQLGRHGRNRSNLWAYPSAKTAGTGSDEGNMLANHPTPKPVRLVADAILDCTRRGDIVLDLFLGSGTTLIAAEKVGRVCYAVELDALYVDLAIRRWQAWTGEQAVHGASGRTFDAIATDKTAI